MGFDLEEYKKIKRKADETQQAISTLNGAIGQQMKQLKEEFNVDSIEEAESLLAEMSKKQKRIEKKYNAALKQLRRDTKKVGLD